jgi:acyl-CoA synthetase (NDP forming)
LTSADAVHAEVEALFARIRERQPNAHVDGVLVQRMVTGGHETIAGVTRDRMFGPLVMFGLGGIYVEALHDVVFRVAPIDAREADAMVEGIRGARILHGIRGQPPADRAALVNVLRRLAQLASDIPEILELDINPLLAREDGAVAADARIRVGRPVADREPTAWSTA